MVGILVVISVLFILLFSVFYSWLDTGYNSECATMLHKGSNENVKSLSPLSFAKGRSGLHSTSPNSSFTRSLRAFTIDLVLTNSQHTLTLLCI